MKISFSVRSLILFLVTAFTVPAVLLFGFIEARRGLEHSAEDVGAMNRQGALIVQREIGAAVERFKALFEGISADVDIKNMRFSNAGRTVEIARSNSVSLILLNEKAVSVAAFTINNIPTGIDYSDREHIQRARVTGKTAVSGNFLARTTNTPFVFFCVPLKGPGGEVVGFINGAVPPDRFRPNYSLPPGQFAVVLDAFGGVVASINADRVMEAAPDMAKAPKGESRFRAKEVDEHIHVAEVFPISWKVIVGFRNSYVTGLGREAVWSAALVGLLCAAIGVVVASLLAFSTARGLDGIARQVQRMRVTDLQQIDIPRHGLYPQELRTFIGNFNNLLDRTARMRLAEFEAISRVSDTILIADSNGRITYANKAGARLVGDVTGALLKAIIGEETASAILSRDRPREWKGDCSVKMSQGGSFDGFLSSSPVLEDGTLTSVVIIVTDITREKAAREASAQSEKMITIGELVAGTSHELNNPLAIVTGYADLLLEEGGLSPEQRSKIESIRKGAFRASNIVHSLLAFARKRTPERVPTDVNSIVEAALQLKEYDIVTSGIRLERDLAVDLPPVLADPHQIQQVLLNVLNNAQDATVGTANVPAIAVKSEMGEGKIIIRIEDTGSGISKADLKKVFDPFFTTKPLGKGTGLGLSISYGIVREHGGEIQIQSQAGRGTQVRIELPAEESDAVGSPAQSGEARKIFPKKVLVVDDEPEIVSIMQTAFTRNGSTVDSAASIEEALALATKNEYDFVITDVKMPRGSGIDLYKQLCAVKPSYRGRIVFLTGDTNNPSTMQFFEEEGAVYFSKPLDFQAMEKFVTSAESQAKPG